MKIRLNVLFWIITTIAFHIDNTCGGGYDLSENSDVEIPNSDTLATLESHCIEAGIPEKFVIKESSDVYPEKIKGYYAVTTSLFQSDVDNENYSHFRYYVPKYHMLVLNPPNKPKYLLFNGRLLSFDYSAKFPIFDDWALVNVFTCRHKNPVLISFFYVDAYFFYSLKRETSKWSDCKMPNLKRYDASHEHRSKCYRPFLNNNQQPFTVDVFNEAIRLTKELCNGESCEQSTIDENPVLELIVVPDSLVIAAKAGLRQTIRVDESVKSEPYSVSYPTYVWNGEEYVIAEDPRKESGFGFEEVDTECEDEYN